MVSGTRCVVAVRGKCARVTHHSPRATRHVICGKSRVTHHSSRVASHVSLHTCHFSHATSHVPLLTCRFSRVTHHVSLITCRFSRVTHHVSLITCHFSRVTHHVSLITCDSRLEWLEHRRGGQLERIDRVQLVNPREQQLAKVSERRRAHRHVLLGDTAEQREHRLEQRHT